MGRAKFTAAFLLGICACAVERTPRTPSVAVEEETRAALAWLDRLDVRYTAFALPQTLARWQRAIGEEPLDTGVADEAEIRFYADGAMRQRLRAFASHPSGEVAARAQAWITFLERDRLENDPQALDIAEQMFAVIEGEDGSLPADALVDHALMGRTGDGGMTPREALAEIEARSEKLLPLFEARARRLDVVAQELGAPDVATYVGGARSLETLDAVCRAQVQRTREDWDALLDALTQRLGHAPAFAEIAPATVAWTNEAGAFFDPEALPRLAADAVAKMGFHLSRMHIVFANNPSAVGGSVYGVSIPDDVRFQSNFTKPGFESARGYFHELGHAIHMKMVRQPHLPARQLPVDRALSEGVGEIFGMISRDPAWVRATFPALTPAQIDAFTRSVRGFDALAVRLHCVQARLEQELYAGRGASLHERWPVIFRETFGMAAPVGPSWISWSPASILRPFDMWARVYQVEVRDTFLERLGDTALLSPEAGRLLTETILAHGNALSLEAYLEQPSPATKAERG